jgi:Flp pilus assembly protein TadG
MLRPERIGLPMLVSHPELRAPLAPRYPRGHARCGAAAVEFAFVAPLLFMVILGIIEFGRGMMVAELLNSAARNGSRVGALTGSDNAAISAAVTNALSGTGVSGASCTIRVNGNPAANAATAVTGDAISVTVTVPYSSVSWLPVNQYLGGRTLGSTVVMRRE